MNNRKISSITSISHLIQMVVIAVLTLYVASCSHNYNTLIDEYNKAFQMLQSSRNVPQPGDPDFKERDMLLEKYAVSENATLNLAAPYNCSEYTWTINEVIQTNNIMNPIYSEKQVNNVQLSNGTTLNTREFVCYIPMSNLVVDTYKLYLEVVGNDGITYKDSCLLVIHRHLQ